MNQFITRLVNHVVNEVLVEGLAKSRLFQRFAVRTDATLKTVEKSSTQAFRTTFGEAEANNLASSSSSNATASGRAPPQKPMTGLTGFIGAFFKEIRKDMSGGGR